MIYLLLLLVILQLSGLLIQLRALRLQRQERKEQQQTLTEAMESYKVILRVMFRPLKQYDEMIDRVEKRFRARAAEDERKMREHGWKENL